MKYMGSKTWLLQNGLGDRLRRLSSPGGHFVDLFSGSAAVAWFGAEVMGMRVTAVDLQSFSRALAGAVIGRTRRIDFAKLERTWLYPAEQSLARDESVAECRRMLAGPLTGAGVVEMRQLAAGSMGRFTSAYGGHYFSVEQTRILDVLRATLPPREPHATVCLAALVMGASKASASPGHTAQPFRPTPRALPYIEQKWTLDLLSTVKSCLIELSARHALHIGAAVVADAHDAVSRLTGDEIVFVDPPYSAAQYSRFYHVLEAVAVGGYDSVYGAGRAPNLADRPDSEFSRKASARDAVARLIEGLGRKGSTVVMTFPQLSASNGIDGEGLVSVSREWFNVDVYSVHRRASTLGGNGITRPARQRSQELILTMRAK